MIGPRLRVMAQNVVLAVALLTAGAVLFVVMPVILGTGQ
jgi:hypothetical protein